MILSGTLIADQIRAEMAAQLLLIKKERKPHLAVVLVGNIAASQTYVGMKKKACEEVGMISTIHTLSDTILEEELLKKIDELNCDKNVDGILIQAPLPKHIQFERVIEKLDPKKDVDGFHPINMGKLLLGTPGGFVPCTPLGIQVLLERSAVPTSGKHVVIVGRSNIVGKPLAALLMQNKANANATVTVANSKTQNLGLLTQTADILIAAVGVPRFIKAEMVKPGAVVIDVGINHEKDPSNSKGYRLVGDVDYDAVAHKCSAITPVPKGVGPMTVAMLLQNTMQSFLRDK
jgi:methylenetetrahydrofolate dehydrogenase (NADP+)/methenyltetrahydrofolate cyclohydrolase